MFRALLEHPLALTIASNLPRRQLMRYLIAGVVNTLYGYAVYAALTYTFTKIWPHTGYLLAMPVAWIINVTLAFLVYKFFIFKTRGGYLREWLRCLAVYGTSFLLQLALLPCLVYVLRAMTSQHDGAPYIAAAILTLCSAFYGFVAHRRFSFAGGQTGSADVPERKV